MSKLKSGFVTLSHMSNGGAIAARADKVVLVEETGEGRLVALENGESFMCSESVDDVVRSIDAAMN